MNALIDRKTAAPGTPYRFTSTEYQQLAEIGFFQPEDHLELLEGEIIIMPAMGVRHFKSVRKINRVFGQRYSEHCIIDCQLPIRLDDASQPQPDLVLASLATQDADHLPTPEDVHLVVEVADSSLGFDRTRKLPAYARTGIREFWIVNLIDDCVEIYRDPSPAGYRDHREARRGDTLAPAAFPDTTVTVGDLLP